MKVRIWLGWAVVIFVAWTAVGVGAIAPLLPRLRSLPLTARDAHSVARVASDVWLWAALTPAMLWLAHRFPIERARWVRRSSLHVILAAGFHVLDVAFDTLVDPWLGTSPPIWFSNSLWEQLSINLISYAATVAIGHGLSYAALYHQRRLNEARLSAELASAKLMALELQIRPHFLFNCLHTIGALIRAQDDQGAIRTLADLGDLLREVLRTDRGHEVPLRDELESVSRRLRIEQVRFGDRLTVQIDVPESALDVPVPCLALHTLAENAVRHGIESRSGPGSITVRARMQEERLRLEVVDSGSEDPAGFSDGMAMRGSGSGSQPGSSAGALGIGLANIRARLAHLYGEGYELELAPLAHCGTVVAFTVPLPSRRFE